MGVVRALLVFLLVLLSAASQEARASKIGILGTPTPGVIYYNVKVPVVASPGTYWPNPVEIIVPEGSVTTGLIWLHGGGGDDISGCQNNKLCSNISQAYTITGATWNSTNQTATFTVSSDPTQMVAQGRGRIVVSFVNPSVWNGTYTATASTSNSVTVYMPETGPPAAFVSGGTLNSPAMTLHSVRWQTPDLFNMAMAFPQGLACLGGTDYGNTPNFTATIDDGTGTGHAGNILTVTALSGALSRNQVLTASGVAGGTAIADYITGNGYNTGKYLLTGSPQLISSESMTANGAPYGPKSTTWTNYAMTSCQNDIGMIADLKAYMHTVFNIALGRFALAGHSNGGMMTERVMLEQPTLFKWFGMIAGPRSIIYDYQPVTPSTYAVNAWWMVGDQDYTICEAPYLGTCTGPKNQFVGSESGTTLHVKSITSGALQVGQALATISGTAFASSTYIASKITTAGGDFATYTTTVSQSISQQTMYTTATYDARTYQATAQETPSDITTPYPMTWDGLMVTAHDWIVGDCNPASLNGRTTLNPADAVTAPVRIGVTRTFTYCGGRKVFTEVWGSGHSLGEFRAALGTDPIVDFMLFIKANP